MDEDGTEYVEMWVSIFDSSCDKVVEEDQLKAKHGSRTAQNWIDAQNKAWISA